MLRYMMIIARASVTNKYIFLLLVDVIETDRMKLSGLPVLYPSCILYFSWFVFDFRGKSHMFLGVLSIIHRIDLMRPIQ